MSARTIMGRGKGNTLLDRLRPLPHSPSMHGSPFARSLLAIAAALSAACAARAPVRGLAGTGTSICFDCFWEHQAPGLREELLGVYRERRYDDPLAEAERRLLVGRVAGDPALLCEAYRIYASAEETDPSRRLLAAESAAFLAEECGDDSVAAFRRAAGIAGEIGDAFKERTYRAIASGTFRPRTGGQTIGRSLDVPPDATGYVLGASAILVPHGSLVAIQAERTVRDWLSYQLNDDLSSKPAERSALVDWHEGARLRDLMAATTVEAHAVRGVLVVSDGTRWLAPDEDGVFRFEVLPDKVQYASTRVHGDVALLVDTHGVSAVEREAARTGADLVLACGDDPAKMRAAYRLASEGISVWFPCDRFVADVLGHDAPGVLLGSAPVRATEHGAVIGDTPIAFRLDEKIVVEDSVARGVSQYYDAAGRYFRRLSRIVPLRLDYRMVDGPGQSERVVDRARATGATAIALRVATTGDAEPVRAWLSESKTHRVVLFHSAPYPAGIALFADYPGQTTFGDPHPVWTR